MTVEEYREYLRKKRIDAEEARNHYEKLCREGAKGEMNPCRLAKQYAALATKWQYELDKEQADPRVFAEDADIWERRNRFPLH